MQTVVLYVITAACWLNHCSAWNNCSTHLQREGCTFYDLFTQVVQYNGWSQFNTYHANQQRYNEAVDSVIHLCSNIQPGTTKDRLENVGPESGEPMNHRPTDRHDWKMRDQIQRVRKCRNRKCRTVSRTKCSCGKYGTGSMRPILHRDLNWKNRKNVLSVVVLHLVPERFDHFVTAVITFAFNWHIINGSLSSIR